MTRNQFFLLMTSEIMGHAQDAGQKLSVEEAEEVVNQFVTSLEHIRVGLIDKDSGREIEL